MDIEYKERASPFFALLRENYFRKISYLTFNVSPVIRFVNTEIVFLRYVFLFCTETNP